MSGLVASLHSRTPFAYFVISESGPALVELGAERTTARTNGAIKLTTTAMSHWIKGWGETRDETAAGGAQVTRVCRQCERRQSSTAVAAIRSGRFVKNKQKTRLGVHVCMCSIPNIHNTLINWGSDFSFSVGILRSLSRANIALERGWFFDFIYYAFLVWSILKSYCA